MVVSLNVPRRVRVCTIPVKTTLQKSGEDAKTTLETSLEDTKTTLKTSGEDAKTTLATSVL